MIPEVGHFALICAFMLSLGSASLLYFGKSQSLDSLARTLNFATCFCVLISASTLIYSAMIDDYSVDYIANNANSNMPLIFKATMLWGAHEGSILLWLLIMCIWSLYLNHQDLIKVRTLSQGIMGLLTAGIALFILATSNPFLRLLPNAPIEGADLNPLLQDAAFVIHPPVLYAGYVGLSIPFVLALCLLFKPTHRNIVHHMRRTTLIAWSFLTMGIALGSWWAYYELGWGGWWFWDPVENASLMPWLASCALLHILIVHQKRGHFKGLLILLAILSFAMSLLGTFLVRSGVLTSVHSFASSPERGVYLLLYFTAVIGGAFALFVIKLDVQIQLLKSWSKEFLLLTQAFAMLVFLGVVLLGTLYPLFMDAFFATKISVGAPYFSSILLPMFCVLLVLMSFVPLTRWCNNSWSRIRKPLMLFSFMSALVILGVSQLLSLSMGQSFVFTLGLGLFIMSLATIRWRAVVSSMTLGHLGLAIFAIAIALTTAFDLEQDVALVQGQSVAIGKYTFKLNHYQEIDNPHYLAAIADMDVFAGGGQVAHLRPEKRFYKAREMALSETAIHPGLIRDLYVAMGEPLEQGWSMRIYIKPFVRWIWLGAAMMALAGFWASFRMRKRKEINKYEACYG